MRRKPFAAIRKGIVEHVLSGRLRATGFALYVWLHLRADHTTGTTWTNAARLATELGLHPVTVRRELSVLKRARYIGYTSPTGSQRAYEITIEKYHEHFEGAPGRLHERLQGGLHEGLHERPRTPRNSREFGAPKNKEVRNTSLRVRRADAIPPEKIQREKLLTENLLSKTEALAQAPRALRETLELYCLKTGRDAIDPADLECLPCLDAAHTPAMIQKAITHAVERFERRGEDPAALTLQYLWESLRHYTTRKPQNAQREAPPNPQYPIGLTRLW